MNRKARGLLALTRAIARAPHGPLFSPEDGGQGGGGGGGSSDDAPKFTQKDFDSALGKRLADERKKFADYETIKSQAQKAAEYEAELTKLREEKELEGKSAAERERIAAEKAQKAIERDRSEWAQKESTLLKDRDAWKSRFVDSKLSDQIDGGLTASKVLSSARSDAVRVFRAEAQIEHDDDGKITSVTYDGIAFKTVAEATAAFLKNKPFYQSNGGTSGGGSAPPNAGGSAPSRVDGSAESLLSAGLAARKR